MKSMSNTKMKTILADGLILNPPVPRNLVAYYTNYLIIIATLLFFAWIQGNWLMEIIPSAVNLPLSFALLILISWNYRIKYFWVFRWHGDLIEICLSENLFTRGRILGLLNSSPLIKVSYWGGGRKKIEIEKETEYMGKEMKLFLVIAQITNSHNLGCHIELDGQVIRGKHNSAIRGQSNN